MEELALWRLVVSFTLLPLYPLVPIYAGWVEPRASLNNGVKREFFIVSLFELRSLGLKASFWNTGINCVVF
jgi:hypothetical protein